MLSINLLKLSAFSAAFCPSSIEIGDVWETIFAKLVPIDQISENTLFFIPSCKRYSSSILYKLWVFIIILADSKYSSSIEIGVSDEATFNKLIKSSILSESSYFLYNSVIFKPLELNWTSLPVGNGSFNDSLKVFALV